MEFRSMMTERLTLGAIKSLEKRPGVTDVILDQRGPADNAAIMNWEMNNCCSLPDDLKQFYLTTDGFLLTWKVKLKDELIPAGRMEVNRIKHLNKLMGSAGSGQTGCSIADIDLTEEEDPSGHFPHFDARSRLFEIDGCQQIGKVCLVYRNTKQGVPAKDGEYWFLDKALRWHFITKSFQSYFRIMLINLGLPQWQYLFTEIGTSPSVQQWYSLYTPGSTAASITETTESDSSVNQLDVARVFKGKDKRKPGNTMPNKSTGLKTKATSPVPPRNSGLRGTGSAMQKSSTNPLR